MFLIFAALSNSGGPQLPAFGLGHVLLGDALNSVGSYGEYRPTLMCEHVQLAVLNEVAVSGNLLRSEVCVGNPVVGHGSPWSRDESN